MNTIFLEQEHNIRKWWLRLLLCWVAVKLFFVIYLQGNDVLHLGSINPFDTNAASPMAVLTIELIWVLSLSYALYYFGYKAKGTKFLIVLLVWLLYRCIAFGISIFCILCTLIWIAMGVTMPHSLFDTLSWSTQLLIFVSLGLDIPFYIFTLRLRRIKKTRKAGACHVLERQSEKLFIGLELRTNNQECSSTMPAHKERFFSENILAKISNKINDNVVALYTDYEGDDSKPYSWILGCEVSSLDNVPAGLVAKVIPQAQYAVFTTQGKFPQGLIATWQAIWSTNLPRAYTSDFELYRSDFDSKKKPVVKVYIAIKEETT